MTSIADNITGRPVTIIGSGMLGRRIGLMLASRGGVVRLYDPSEAARESAGQFILGQLPAVVAQLGGEEKGHRIGTVELHDTIADAVSGAGFIVEAAPESASVKRDILGELDRLAEPTAIVASNSSSYVVADFMDVLSTPERVLNVHFHNPPHYLAVDVMSSEHTTDEVVKGVEEVLTTFGLHPFRSEKADAGFPFNRLLEALTREACLMIADGTSTAEVIDSIWKVDTGLEWGPCSIMDEIGLDVVLAIEKHRLETNPALPSVAADVMTELVNRGTLGRKSGQGFFDYRGIASE
ncbi:3-hydroxyacyl-CoA dehydrogenase family protein [Rhodococcus sp. IEGM 1381]|uniref:3-hydroxyacyl-CoA dehydrogenase family protein n=1 Tax=Rhodococcus sp. IEGM 1381 TaxID=3047085 RepID=UPI0024B71708|nr:3-hydroxyacyl-CoA dehydrogenase family protein [Rhodococcus sp. IEGM 1381]MDI9897430.1 3-hydroxyacyl-CoA dehydrogenase family protein [Rhodococcus sp. IEGM 1381]